MFVHRTPHTVAALLLVPLALACRDKARPTTNTEAAGAVVSASVPESKPEAGTDFEAIEAGAIAVTPMHFDLTDIDGMDRLERLSLADLLEQDPAVERA